MTRANLTMFLLLLLAVPAWSLDPARTMKFQAKTQADGLRWQQDSRQKLFALMMGGQKPQALPLQPEIVKRTNEVGYVLEEVTLQSLPGRKVHAWLAVPNNAKGKMPAVLALHGHGGRGEDVVRGKGLYWYGKALVEKGYVVIAPDIGSHTLQNKNWSLMGERTWDALRCLDYLADRPEVDAERLAVAGLSLGGETTMYVAALDERLKVVCSSGWLTTVANMKRGHCPCWNFKGLEEHFDFADIFACIAPRPLICEIGAKERAPGGFPVDLARKAFAEIQPAYGLFAAPSQVHLAIHPGGHVFHGQLFWETLNKNLRPRPRGN